MIDQFDENDELEYKQRDLLNIEFLEDSLIGSILKDSSGKLFFDVADKIIASDFLCQTNSVIFSLISEYLFNKGNSLLDIKILQSRTDEEIIRVKIQELFEDKDLQISDIYAATNEILNRSKLRSLNVISNNMCIDVVESTLSASEIIEKYESQIFSLSEHKADDFITPAECLQDVVNQLTATTETANLSTSLPSLDVITNGFEPGGFFIIAARPSMGKSAILLQMLAEIAMKNIPVGFFSLEMTKKMIIERLISYMCKIPLHKIRSRNLNPNELSYIKDTVYKVAQLPIIMDCSGGLTPQQFLSRTKRMKMKYNNLAMVAIDYMQLMPCPSVKGGREQEVSHISDVLKRTAKDIMIPVIGVSQLSRAVEQRENKRPILSDLRDSGAIEQSADIVLFIYRDSYYSNNKEDQTAELIVAKNRNGPTGKLLVSAELDVQRFSEK